MSLFITDLISCAFRGYKGVGLGGVGVGGWWRSMGASGLDVSTFSLPPGGHLNKL